MADHIPFITGVESCRLVSDIYGDSRIVRNPLDRAGRLTPELPNRIKVWIDPAVDGLDDLPTRVHKPNRQNPWYEFIRRFPHHDRIADASFQKKPDSSAVVGFVDAVLDQCVRHKPEWITVPQLPLADDSSRNKINRSLAQAAGRWKSKSKFPGSMILPLVFTHQRQINGKTARNPKVKQAAYCYNEAGASGLWVVDKSLVDDSGSPTLRNKRIPAIICLHQELNEAVPSTIRIAGPYWGLNLVLWARGLIDYLDFCKVELCCMIYGGNDDIKRC